MNPDEDDTNASDLVDEAVRNVREPTPSTTSNSDAVDAASPSTPADEAATEGLGSTDTTEDVELEIGNAEDLVDETAGTVPVEEPLPAKEFRGWHKPRKQFVREEQWCAAILDLVQELSLAALGRPLCYLSLPGDELLDVRALHEHCSATGVNLRFLGYNAIDGDPPRVAESRLSESEVKSLSNIHVLGSQVVHDPLEDIAVERTMAHQAARRLAPYDVINIDLCNGVANAPPQTRHSTLQAIRCLLEIQVSTCGSPWLLFLTTRVGRTLLDRDAQALLHARVLQNATDEAFSTLIAEMLGFSKDELAGEQSRTRELSPTALQRALTLGVSKWVLGVISSTGAWSVELLPSYAYQIGDSDSSPLDMVSLGFRVRRTPVKIDDPSGLTAPVLKQRAPASEARLALDMVRVVARLMDIDELIGTNEAMFEKLVDSHARLLSRARYDPDKYRQWVADGCP